MQFNVGSEDFVPRSRRNATPQQPPTNAAPKKSVVIDLGAIAKSSVDTNKEVQPETTVISEKETQTISKSEPVKSQPKTVVEHIQSPPITDISKEEEEEELRLIDAEEKKVIKEDPRESVNVIFIGHVDAGKSTISGQILWLTGMVDKRTIERYEREAKEKNRDSWWLAYVLDSIEEEKTKGKTIEVGRANFTTENRRFTLLDAPGHKSYVPNMIVGAAQADFAILVISARRGEFETGFERGGQTCEHVQLARTVGIQHLIVVINKMDEPSVNYSKDRFDSIVKKLVPFLKHHGFKQPLIIPVSGITGANIKEKSDLFPWYTGPTLIEAFDSLPLQQGRDELPLRIPIIDKYKDARGMPVVMGKIETGVIEVGNAVTLMPSKVNIEVLQIGLDENMDLVTKARSGDNIRVQFKGESLDNVNAGFVICAPDKLIPTVNVIEAQLVILDLSPTDPVFSAGFRCVCHMHTAVEECAVVSLLTRLDRSTGEVAEKRPKFALVNSVVTCRLAFAKPVCVEKFSDFQQLGRFTLRDQGRTIAIGKVLFVGKRQRPE